MTKSHSKAVDMEFSEKFLQLFFFSAQVIDRKLKILSKLEKIVQFIEFLIVAFLLVRRTFHNIPSISNIMVICEEIFDDVNKFSKPEQVYCVFMGSLGFLFLISVIILRSRLFSSHQKDYVSWALVAFLLTFRLNCHCFSIQTYFIFFSQNSSFPNIGVARFILMPLFLFPSAYCMFLNRHKITLSYFYALVPIIWVSNQNEVLLQGSTLLFSIYTLLDNQNQREWEPYINLIFIINLFLLISRINTVIEKVDLICWALILLFVVLSNLIPKYCVSLASEMEIQIQQYWVFTQKNKKDNKITIQDQYKISQILISSFRNMDGNQILLIKPLQKPILEWRQTQLLLLRQIYIQLWSKKCQNYKAQIFLFKHSLENCKINIKTLVLIQQKFAKLQGSQVLYRLQLYKLIIQHQQNLFQKDRKQAQYLLNIMEFDNKITIFYQTLYLALKTLKSIWQDLLNHKVGFNSIEKKYAEVLQYQKNIQKIYKTVQKKSQSHRQLQMFTAFNSLFDFGPDQNLDQNFDEIEYQIEFNRKYSQTPFLILVQNKITYVPFSFSKSYYYLPEDLLGNNIDIIASPTLKNHLYNMSNKDEGFKIRDSPEIIKNGLGFIVLVHTKQYLFPFFEEGLKSIAFFQNKAKNEGKKSYILFNCFTGIIEDVSFHFLQQFEIEKDLFMPEGEQLLAKDFFQSLDLSKKSNQQSLLQEGGISTVLTLKNTNLMESQKLQKYNVNLKTICSFNEIDKPRLVIEVHKGKLLKETVSPAAAFRKAIIKTQTKLFQKLQSQVQMEDRIISTFYIQLNQKKKQMRRTKQSQSLVSLTFIIFGFILSFTLCIIALYIIGNMRIQEFQTMLNTIDNFGKRNIIFSAMYFQGLKLYHFKKYPPNQLTQAQILNRIQIAAKILETSTNTFQSIYLKTLQNQKFSEINFNLSFQNFNLESNTNNIFLIDFIWELTLARSTNWTGSFLVDNFQMINILRKQIGSLSQYFIQYNSFTIILASICSLMVIVTIIFVLIFFIYSYKVEHLLVDVQSLYQYLPKKCQTQILEKIQTLLNEFEEIILCNQNLQKATYQYDFIQNQEQTKIKTAINWKKTFLWKNGLIILLIIFISCAFILPVTQRVYDEKSETLRIVELGHRLKIEQIDTQNSLLNIYFKIIQLQQKPSTIYEPIFVSKLIQISYEAADISSLQSFNNKSWLYLNSNLCLQYQNKDQYLKCENIYDGILKYGYTKSFKLYEKTLQNISTKTLNALYSDRAFTDALFLQQILLKQLNFISLKYMDNLLSYKKYLAHLNLCIHFIGLITMVLIGAILYVKYRFSRERIYICKSMFINSSNEMVSSAEAREYIKRIDLIQRMRQL